MRVFGLLFVYKAVLALLGMVKLVVLGSMFTILLSTLRAETYGEFASVMEELAKSQAISTPVSLFIYGLAAWYFLKGAPVLTRFIARYGKESEAP